MGHYTRYKAYMENLFWPWFWSDPCKNCNCVQRGLSLFDECSDYNEWLKRKPIYNKPLDSDAKKTAQVC